MPRNLICVYLSTLLFCICIDGNCVFGVALRRVKKIACVLLVCMCKLYCCVHEMNFSMMSVIWLYAIVGVFACEMNEKSSA